MISNKRLAPVFGLLLVFTLLLSACAGGNNNNDSDGTGGTAAVPNTGNGNGTVVNVDMTSFKFQLDQPTIPAGPVTFHATNTATDVEHEMVVLKTDMQGKDLPTKDDGTVDESQLNSLGELEAQVGESKDLTVNLEPGHYVLLCNVAGHYAQGMFLDFTVQ
jgi:uncharacterized cupredoxin-like copper-binding protein